MTAQRIVSLLPGATEWVCALGLTDRLVGVSHECDFPPAVNSLPRVTRSHIDVTAASHEIDAAVRQHSRDQASLYDLDVQSLHELQPDLILTQTLCNVCAVSEADVRRSLRGIDGCQLLDLSATTFEKVLWDAEAIIAATGSLPTSTTALANLRARISDVQQSSEKNPHRLGVTLIEWADPLFCSGHWTPQLIEWAGGFDPIGGVGQPSRQISAEELIAADPDLLLVACCGLDAERNAAELESLSGRIADWSSLSCVKSGDVHVFDGSALFNRPGPRLVDALEMVAKLVAAKKHNDQPTHP